MVRVRFRLGPFLFLCVVFTRMEERIDTDADPMQPESEAAEAHYVWQYFTVENHTEAKKGGSKNALCMFCDKVFSGCSTARAAAHLLGRPVMGQHKAGIQACVAINKKDDDRRGSLRQARKTVGEAVRVKEHSLAGIKRKQQVLDELATPSPKQKSVESSLTGSQTTGSKEVDAAIASFVYEKPWWPELAMVGMRVLSQVISASSCERNWSAHGHIHTKIRNRLDPATTEKLVYVYSNSKLVTATRDADKLKMFAWDNEDV